MISLSVTVITLNEEGNIGRCLESVKNVADEIIVVDSFSSDRTMKIAREMGAKVFEREFDGYVQQKNYSQDKATFDYVLSLDADEALTPELINSILEVKRNWAYDGYHLNRISSYCGEFIGHGSWLNERRLRLYDKRKGHWIGQHAHDANSTIHEKISLDKNSRTKLLTGDLYHYRFNTISEQVRQADHFSDITAREAFKSGVRSNWFRILANPLWRFFKDYFLKHGFLGGKYGFAICLISSWEQALKYLKLYELQRKEAEGVSTDKSDYGKPQA